MEMHERVRELRKKYLHMSQTAFGEKLGVSRDVIKNIELNALAKPEQKLSLLKLMSKEFNISEEWLLNGTGDMFASKVAEYRTLIEQIMTGENDFAKNIFKTFAVFEEKDWEALHHMIEMYTTVAAGEVSDVMEFDDDDVPDTPEELEALFPPIEPDEQGMVG